MQRTYIYLTITAVVGLLAAMGVYFYTGTGSTQPPSNQAEVATSTAVTLQKATSTIGTSVEGRDIRAYTYQKIPSGNIAAHVAFVGAIHGGYEWNTVLLARRFMSEIESNSDFLPENIKVTVIPMLNPDGVHEVLGTVKEFTKADAPSQAQTEPGRFNANGVDLNRNFACNWEPTSRWRNQEVDAGTAAFSEPESRAMRDFVRANNPNAVIFFHSAADGVYGASCGGSISDAGRNLMNTYASAAGYPAIESFDYYEITGDAEGWLAKLGIPSVSVELRTHQTVEWQQNKAGIKAVLHKYSTQE